ncbi:hypothetical protein HT594_00005 [Phenacoccus solenopsis nudivirus]|nr:hypothetical protein HT594_00005 [Phenacoccus solenopsis nudivirus]
MGRVMVGVSIVAVSILVSYMIFFRNANSDKSSQVDYVKDEGYSNNNNNDSNSSDGIYDVDSVYV